MQSIAAVVLEFFEMNVYVSVYGACAHSCYLLSAGAMGRSIMEPHAVLNTHPVWGSNWDSFLLFQSACIAAADDAFIHTGYAVRLAGFAFLTPALYAARFELENGLKFLFLPDPDTPLFAYQTWFSVGSRHESVGETGIAHLFEHLMFKGTERYPAGTFDKEMERRGAQTNAATFVDWTYYRETLPADEDNFKTVVMFESDRMVHLSLTQAVIEAEREVVKNERLERVDNSIDGLLDEAVFEVSFLKHGYKHPTIGLMDDLNRMSHAQLVSFYRKHYAPNQAVVVIVGRLSLNFVVRTMAQYYGPLLRQPVEDCPVIIEPPMDKIRRKVLYEDTESERLTMAFLGPAQTDPDHIALQIVAEVLCGGETGRLYQALVVEQEFCQEIQASVTPFAEPGLFQVEVLMKPGVPSVCAENYIVKTLQELADNQMPTEEELMRAKNRIESAFWRGLLDVDGQAEQIGHYETTTQDASFVMHLITAVRSMQVAQLVSAIRRYLNPAAYASVIVQPKEEN